MGAAAGAPTGTRWAPAGSGDRNPKPPSFSFASHNHQRPPPGQGAPQLGQRTAARGVQDEIPAAGPIGEVLADVVDHLVRAERLGQLHANDPTPPAAPMISTRCPDCTCPLSRRACRAVKPEMGTAAACSKVRLAGLATSLPGRAHTYPANDPPPIPNTSSPRWNPVTFVPTASTRPATSLPRTRTLGVRSP